MLETSSKNRWMKLALGLVAGTLAYNVIEAVVAIWAGSVSGSIALMGFGLDSVIETAAAGVLMWRLSLQARGASERAVERSERRVQLFVGVTFIVLAIYVLGQSAWSLYEREAAQESLPGIILAGLSLVVMPLVAWGKMRAAARIGSPALRAEAKETLACSYLSLTLLIGLAANALAGWWWADPVAALLMVPWLVKEGVEGIRGEEDEADGEDDEGGETDADDGR